MNCSMRSAKSHVQRPSGGIRSHGMRRSSRRTVFGTSLLILSAIGVVLGQHQVAGGATAAPRVDASHATVVPRNCSYAPSPQGYLQATALGDVLASGTARLYGTLMDRTINEPVVGLAGTPTANGYWEVAADGGLFAFGDAGFHGSMGGSHLNQPIVGIAGTPDGGGYWMVASDGGIFAFGDAGFHGSMGGTHLVGTITGMASTPGGAGYWLSGADGGIFAFGDASFQGSFAGGFLPSQTVGIVGVPATASISPPILTQSSDTSIFEYGDDYYYAAAGQAVTDTGASAEMCATDAGLTSVDQHSLTELAVAFDPGLRNVIEIGWDDSSPEMGDLLPHLFVNWWKDGVSQNCSYFYVQRCGFIEVPALAQPIMYVPVGTTASYAVEQVGHQWNFYFDGQLFGYFPDSLWDGASTTMQYCEVYGEVAARAGAAPSIMMGNGLFGHQAGADRVTGYQLLGTAGATAAFQWALNSVAASYDIAATQTSFSYGGPGGSRGMSGPQITVGGARLSARDP